MYLMKCYSSLAALSGFVYRKHAREAILEADYSELRERKKEKGTI